MIHTAMMLRLAQLICGRLQVQAPWFDEHQQEQRPERLGEPIHRDIDERLGLVLQLGRQRHEEDFPRGLVDGVAHRLIEHPRDTGPPERTGDEHQRGRHPETHREQHEGEPHAQESLDAADQPDLNHKTDRGGPELDRTQALCDRIGSGFPPAAFTCSATAMLSCCSIKLAPIAAKLITMAIICRCLDSRNRRNASKGPTPFPLSRRPRFPDPAGSPGESRSP